MLPHVLECSCTGFKATDSQLQNSPRPVHTFLRDPRAGLHLCQANLFFFRFFVIEGDCEPGGRRGFSPLFASCFAPLAITLFMLWRVLGDKTPCLSKKRTSQVLQQLHLTRCWWYFIPQQQQTECPWSNLLFVLPKLKSQPHHALKNHQHPPVEPFPLKLGSHPFSHL